MKTFVNEFPYLPKSWFTWFILCELWRYLHFADSSNKRLPQSQNQDLSLCLWNTISARSPTRKQRTTNPLLARPVEATIQFRSERRREQSSVATLALRPTVRRNWHRRTERKDSHHQHGSRLKGKPAPLIDRMDDWFRLCLVCDRVSRHDACFEVRKSVYMPKFLRVKTPYILANVILRWAEGFIS